MKTDIRVDLNFLDYAKFILGFSGVDSLYDVTDEAIAALHKAYPKVRFAGRINDNMRLELIVGISEDECYGFLDNRLIDNDGNIIAENDAICTTSNNEHMNFRFKVDGEDIEINLVEGGFKCNNKSGEVSEIVNEKSTDRMSLF